MEILATRADADPRFRMKWRYVAVGCLSFALLLLAPALASQELVDRKLYVELPQGIASPAWLAELLRAAIGERGGPILVGSKAEADAVLSTRLAPGEGGSGEAVAALADLLAGEGSSPAVSRTYPLASLDSAELIATLVRPLAEEVVAALPALPQRVRNVESVRTVEKFTTVERAKGVRVVLRGPPGARLAFSDGGKVVIGDSGVYVLEEVPQNSSIVLMVSATGYHDTKRSFRVDTEDAAFDLEPEAFEKWGVWLGWTSSLLPTRLELSLGLPPRHLEAGLGFLVSLGGSIWYGSDGLNSSDRITLPAFVQPDLSLSVQVLPEDWPLRLWLGASVLTRFDWEDGFGWSKRLRVAFQAPLALEFWFNRSIALRAELAPMAFVGEPWEYSSYNSGNQTTEHRRVIEPQGGNWTYDAYPLGTGTGLWYFQYPVMTVAIRVAF
jgi:hypothetical protein